MTAKYQRRERKKKMVLKYIVDFRSAFVVSWLKTELGLSA